MADVQIVEQRIVNVNPRPVHSLLVQFPAVCFTLVLLTDIAYWRTVNLMWQNFSSWLVFTGLVVGFLAAVAWLFEVLVRPSTHAARPSWPYAITGVAVLLLAFLNSLVHAGDGWTGVVPWGLALSALTFLVMIACYFLGRHDIMASDRVTDLVVADVEEREIRS